MERSPESKLMIEKHNECVQNYINSGTPEIWRPAIVTRKTGEKLIFPDYQCSNLGRVFMSRSGMQKDVDPWCIKITDSKQNPVLAVRLAMKNGVSTNVTLSRLVASVFMDEDISGKWVRLKDPSIPWDTSMFNICVDSDDRLVSYKNVDAYDICKLLTTTNMSFGEIAIKTAFPIDKIVAIAEGKLQPDVSRNFDRRLMRKRLEEYRKIEEAPLIAACHMYIESDLSAQEISDICGIKIGMLRGVIRGWNRKYLAEQFDFKKKKPHRERKAVREGLKILGKYFAE